MANFTWLDFLVFGIFFLSAIIGLSRGLLKEIISIMAVIVALIVMIKFTAPLTNLLTSTQGAADVISAISTFFGFNATGALSTVTLGISILVLFGGSYLTAEAVNYYVPIDMMMFPNIGSMLFRLLGGAAGLIKGYVINVVFLLLVQLSPISQTDAWTQSYFAPRLQPNISQLLSMIQPSGIKAE